ncbi:Chimeric ERCC6-PGBD3 protein [Araneus ventricosus]|uniref:Chimeric ERCC6-PGBD3 protein n=1 Tax=Araneus ventricosus TaxID=182803 RepID=A0A4Y2B1X4_ARAVE|nr:Chimeric ERCC6-PGBD3 protein [Araneus ventricosus]
MIPYRGKHSAKMFLKGKPIRFGSNAWTLASSKVYVHHFDIYSGKSTGPKSSEYEDFGLGEGAVLNLLSIVESPGNHALYFDNFFTSFHLLCHLTNKYFSAAAKIREKRIKAYLLESVKLCSEDRERLLRFSVRRGKKSFIVQWNDNSVVTLGSTFGKLIQ